MVHSDDVYGVSGPSIEADSDVNEDRHREEQLDDSFEAWYGEIEQQLKERADLANVPPDNVFDSALALDEES
ncbi:hypothetical protein [Paenibacillus flagellatus]|uniref:Uncharacterized protein n=1 Tax=Paenibacillus flagellatus TaxID=2211139 RepID=A0A2V5KMV9_9BACL|nr:hypothetical protein [Paenibacillus flagellatus]PYI56590.1 hypothetical protein DLM86_06375 [Paenibacillus flagellatus]